MAKSDFVSCYSEADSVTHIMSCLYIQTCV